MPFTKGKSGNPKGRKKGVKTQQTRLKAVLPIALDKVISEAEHGSFEASAVLVSRFGDSPL